ncbi:hypothetical protein HNR60_001998 [Rhodopseudomonas rhenobacensis]|uniref:DUF2029 domain-containing protein n=1 Tax=Rhodopseudomonas rhenobacensis TaxID=87461 RepID=A0A7W7Z3E8_9BRAD|nr:glycosyltransferase 87 family protein [Rhodopseudomonas rhenobacensis]MBB5047246.1 hypothetical protein [Rhodopseudomonas rhenobacensis]
MHPVIARSLATARSGGPAALLVLPIFVVATLYGWAVVVSTAVAPGAVGLNHIGLGTDWMVFYGAIRAVLDGNLTLLFDGDRFTAYLNSSLHDWLSSPLAFRPWFYPPSFLVMLRPFAPLGFFGSYLAFQALSAALLALALLRGADRPQAAGFVALAALISPAAAINITDGQCALLVAGLIVAGFRALPRRTVLAGVLLGLLSFKPQFCLLLPIALVAAGQWRALLAAAGSALALAAVSALMFGLEIWIWWLPRVIENLVSADPKWVAYGRIWGHSVYACVRLLGAGEQLASALQLIAVVGATLATVIAFRARLAPDLRLALLLAATILAAPHSGPYDAVLLVVALGLWLASCEAPWAPGAWLLAAAIWLVPLLSPAVYVSAGRFAPLATIALIGAILIGNRTLARRVEAQT